MRVFFEIRRFATDDDDEEEETPLASFEAREKQRRKETVGNAGTYAENETSKRMTKSFGMTRPTAITRREDRREIPTEDPPDPPSTITNANLRFLRAASLDLALSFVRGHPPVPSSLVSVIGVVRV